MKDKSLIILMEQFIHESHLDKKDSLLEITCFYECMIGVESFSTAKPLGFIQFLKYSKVQNPRLSKFNSYFIGRFWEFTLEHFGLLQANLSMHCLKSFWIWCKKKNFISKNTPMPPDLKASLASQKYTVCKWIKENKI